MNTLKRLIVLFLVTAIPQVAHADFILDVFPENSVPIFANAGVSFPQIPFAMFGDFAANDAALDAGTPVTALDADLSQFLPTIPWIGQSYVFDGLTLITGGGRNPDPRGGNAAIGYTEDVPILGASVFSFSTNGDPALTLDISGLAALAPGTDVVLTLYGIGDNVGQDTGFVSTFAGGSTTLETVYNTDGIRSSSVGSEPFVQFTYTADGVNDTVGIVTQAATNPLTDNRRQFINALSVSVTAAVPEPSSAVLLSLAALGLGFRRRR